MPIRKLLRRLCLLHQTVYTTVCSAISPYIYIYIQIQIYFVLLSHSIYFLVVHLLLRPCQTYHSHLHLLLNSHFRQLPLPFHFIYSRRNNQKLILQPAPKLPMAIACSITSLQEHTVARNIMQIAY